jgi:signal transduction histidine kinase
LTLRTGMSSDGYVEILVCDRGPGLTDKQRRKIFEPFHSTKSDGMGMGLTISRSIVEAHEGKLHVEANPHGGSVFRVQLPSGDAGQ